MYDCLVVGAGPAGAAAARAAAQQLDVLLVEEHVTVGQPAHCTGLVSLSGLRALGWDWKAAESHRVRGALIWSPGLKSIEVRAAEPKAAVLDRAVFDQLAAAAALDAGAEIALSTRAELSGKAVTIRAGRRRKLLRPKVVIAADGAASSLADAADLPPIKSFAVCAQADYAEADLESDEMVQLFLSARAFPGFFGWIVPLGDGGARVGMGIRAGAGDVTKHFELFVRHNPAVAAQLRRAKQISKLAGTIPLEVRRKTVAGSLMAVGDAAGQVKATTGGGIVIGSECGAIAGQVAAEHVLDETKLIEYERRWRTEWGRELALHRTIRDFLDSLPDQKLEKYFEFAAAHNLGGLLAQSGDMDRASSLLQLFERNKSMILPALGLAGALGANYLRKLFEG